MAAILDLSEALSGLADIMPGHGLRVRAAAAALHLEREVVTPEEARDAITGLRSCNEREFGRELGLSPLRARRELELLEGRGLAKMIAGSRGRRWHYARPVAPDGPAQRPRNVPAEVAVVEREVSHEAATSRVRGTGGNTAHNSLLRRAQRAGGLVRRLPGGHVEISGPKGIVRTGSTPGASRFPKTEKALREAGLDI